MIAAAERLRVMGELQADIADLKAERKACFCARAGEYDRSEEPDTAWPARHSNPEQEKPCWRDYDEVIVGTDYDGAALVACEPYDPEQWCESCRRRQEIHEEIVAKTRRLAAMRAALTRAARREATDGE